MFQKLWNNSIVSWCLNIILKIYNFTHNVFRCYYNTIKFLTDITINKKDGYRQQNVRQRQKLISITDYDVCMTFYWCDIVTIALSCTICELFDVE